MHGPSVATPATDGQSTRTSTARRVRDVVPPPGTPMSTPNLAALFAIDGERVALEPYGTGHINDTFLGTYRNESGTTRVLHQRVNTEVFTDPDGVMDNIARVGAQVEEAWRRAGVDDVERRCLRVVPAADGGLLARTDDGEVWRSFHFIDGTRTHAEPTSPAMAHDAAAAFGRFQAQLVDLPGPRLVETIPYFHDTPRRLADFDAAVGADALGRASAASDAIAFVDARRGLARALLDLHDAGDAPERVTHNDTKLSNLLFDTTTDEALCVVDLETTMPGLSLYDFGDLVRSAGARAVEDEADPSSIDVDPELFEALARGYLSEAGAFLTRAERRRLVEAGLVITYETGVRFLADHLSGDTYFKVHRPGHNLDRARAQFAVVASLERRAEQLRARIADVV